MLDLSLFFSSRSPPCLPNSNAHTRDVILATENNKSGVLRFIPAVNMAVRLIPRLMGSGIVQSLTRFWITSHNITSPCARRQLVVKNNFQLVE